MQTLELRGFLQTVAANSASVNIADVRYTSAITLDLHITGPHIAPDMLGKIFEYGVSDQPEYGADGDRGQG